MCGSVSHTHRETAAGWSQQQPDAEDGMHFCVRQKLKNLKKKKKIERKKLCVRGKSA